MLKRISVFGVVGPFLLIGLMAARLPCRVTTTKNQRKFTPCDVQSASNIGSGTVLGTAQKESRSSRGLFSLTNKMHEMRKSPPAARRKIEGRRVPVNVTYGSKGEYEVGFKTRKHDFRHPITIDRVLIWNTFLGGVGNSDNKSWCESEGIALDVGGNVYVTGTSYPTWGSPIRGEGDAFVAKFDANGALQWNTFLGGEYADSGRGIAVDPVGNVYVTGDSGLTWGSPIRPISGFFDAFVAKLDTYGNLQWNTFLGAANDDDGQGIAVDPLGNVYVTGYSRKTWGSPLRPSSGDGDAFVAKLNTNGALQWNTFLGGAGPDSSRALAVDASGNAYVTGDSFSTWGSPIRQRSGYDAFVAKLDTSGDLQWNTFLGAASVDTGYGLAVDASANVYVTGYSWGTWGSPIRPYSGGYDDAYVAKLDPFGNLRWNTFLGGESLDNGQGIAVDPLGNVYVTGYSNVTWGAPLCPHAGGGYDAFVAELDTNGMLQWNAFLGGEGGDEGNGLAVDASANVFVTGSSRWTWGSPIRPFSDDSEINGFVAKIKAGYYLTVSSGLHGTTDPAPGVYSYSFNSSVQVTALPDPYETFVNWTGDTSGTDNPVIVVMDRSKTVKANFEYISAPTASGEKVQNRSFSQSEYINILTWTGSADNASLNIAKYRIFLMDGNVSALLAEVNAGESRYMHRNAGAGARTYRIAAVTGGGYEGEPVTVTIAAKE